MPDADLAFGCLLGVVLKQDQRITFAILVHIELDRGADGFVVPDGFRVGYVDSFMATRAFKP